MGEAAMLNSQAGPLSKTSGAAKIFLIVDNGYIAILI